MADLSNDLRRILATLGQPRTLQGIAGEVLTDPNAPFDVDNAEEIPAKLDELEELGYVKNIGEHGSGETVVNAIAGDEEIPTLHPEKAQAIEQRYTARPDRHLAGGPLYAMTVAGAEALGGEVRPVES